MKIIEQITNYLVLDDSFEVEQCEISESIKFSDTNDWCVSEFPVFYLKKDKTTLLKLSVYTASIDKIVYIKYLLESDLFSFSSTASRLEDFNQKESKVLYEEDNYHIMTNIDQILHKVRWQKWADKNQEKIKNEYN